MPETSAIDSDAGVDDGRPTRGRRWRRVVTLGLLLPLLASAVLVWSASGRQSKLDKVPVAIVNNDQILTDPQPMAAGRSLTAALTHPTSTKDSLEWTLTDSKDAEDGLRDGTYYAVLTVPKDFSSSILSSGTDKPSRGQLSLVSNNAASTTVPFISHQVASAAATSLGVQTTEGYLGNVYGGFNSLAQSSSKAASSASQLAGGTSQLASGASKLDAGAGSLATSLGQVSAGAATLATSTLSVHGGAHQVHSGATGIAQGSGRLHSSAARLSGASTMLAGKSAGLARASHTLARGTQLVSLGVRGLGAADRLLSVELSALSDRCLVDGGSVRFCRRLARSQVHADRLATAAGRLGGRADRTASGADSLADGATSLAHGADALAGGNAQLSGASGKLSSSAVRLQHGAATLDEGSAQLVTGADQLASATRSTAEAGGSVASGSRSLSSSAGKTDDGAHSLSSGLAKQAKSSPTYSSNQQKALKRVVSQPVELTSQVQHDSHGNGWLIAVILAVILWLATLVAALSLDVAGVRRHALAPVSSRRIALSQGLPVVGFAVLQALAVVAALVILPAPTAAVVPLVLLTLLAGLAFALLALALRLALGRAGVTAFVLLLILQLAASGNVIPLETAPALLQKLNGVLPLTAFVNGASQLVSGGHAASLVAVVSVLTVWGAGSALVLVTAVKRRRSEPAPRREQLVLSAG